MYISTRIWVLLFHIFSTKNVKIRKFEQNLKKRGFLVCTQMLAEDFSLGLEGVCIRACTVEGGVWEISVAQLSDCES